MTHTVTPADREAAERFNVNLRANLTGTQLHNLAGVLAAHREASIAPLVEAMKRQAAAVRTLESAQAQELQVLRGKATEEYRAAATLDSELAANAMLTTEVERKTALLKEAESALGNIIPRFVRCMIHSGTDEEYAECAVAEYRTTLSKIRGG